MLSVGFNPAMWPHIDVPACPVCATPNVPQPIRDRYGFELFVSICTTCWLVYLTPRMTAEGYAAFYAGPYRALLSELFPAIPNPPLAYQRALGAVIGAALMRHVRGGVDLLDVGGSTGVFAQAFCEQVPMASVTVVDPSAEELAHAQALGYATVQGTAEDLALGRTFGAILCQQTIDHVLDPLRALRALRQHLAPGGWFWIDMVDYQRAGGMFKLDHPVNWTVQAFRRALKQTGWRVRHALWYGGSPTRPSYRYGVIAEGA